MVIKELCKNEYVIRLDRGDNIIEKLTAFAIENNIASGKVQGIGAVDWVKLGFFMYHNKEYIYKEYNEPLEVVSLIGNISYVDEKPFWHIHGVFSNRDMNTVGGHLVEGRVSLTLELSVQISDTRIERKINNDIGLRLLDI